MCDGLSLKSAGLGGEGSKRSVGDLGPSDILHRRSIADSTFSRNQLLGQPSRCRCLTLHMAPGYAAMIIRAPEVEQPIHYQAAVAIDPEMTTAYYAE